MEAQANVTLLATQYAHELNMNKAAADAEWRLKKTHAAEHADQVEKSKSTMKAQHAHELKIKQIDIDAEWRLRKAESAERVQKSRIAAEALEAVAKKGPVIDGSLINVKIYSSDGC